MLIYRIGFFRNSSTATWWFSCQKCLHYMVEVKWSRLPRNAVIKITLFIFYIVKLQFPSYFPLWLNPEGNVASIYLSFRTGIWNIKDSAQGDVRNLCWIYMILYFNIVYKKTWKDAKSLNSFYIQSSVFTFLLQKKKLFICLSTFSTN